MAGVCRAAGPVSRTDRGQFLSSSSLPCGARSDGSIPGCFGSGDRGPGSCRHVINHHPSPFSLLVLVSLSLAISDFSLESLASFSFVAFPTSLSTDDDDFNMPGGAVTAPVGGIDAVRIEAPVTFKAYLMCAFAAFGGIFFGYDSGYVNGVIGMDYFISTFEDLVSPYSLGFPPSHILTSTPGQSHHPRGPVRRSLLEEVSHRFHSVRRYLLRSSHCR